MMRLVLFFTVMLALSIQSIAQTKITTFIMVRHAEKGDDGTKDPDLTNEGMARANRLAEMLSKTSIDAIYSTSYKRTRNTVAPLAKAKGLDVLAYEGLKQEEIDKMLKDHEGGTVVISGHSNNIPRIVNLLIGKEEFKDFADKDYNNFVVVSVLNRGDVTKVTWLTY